MLAKVPGFAKMKIGEYQCFFFFPENTPAGRE
jgi:hypothetical protein